MLGVVKHRQMFLNICGTLQIYFIFRNVKTKTLWCNIPRVAEESAEETMAMGKD